MVPVWAGSPWTLVAENILALDPCCGPAANLAARGLGALDTPDHMIHFDRDRSLGPWESR